MERKESYYNNAASSYLYHTTTPPTLAEESDQSSAAPAAPAPVHARPVQVSHEQVTPEQALSGQMEAEQAAIEHQTAGPDVVVDMSEVEHAVQMEQQRPMNPFLQRSIQRRLDAATRQTRMIKRIQRAQKIAATRETVASGDTSSALIMSTLITPAMLENLVTLVMNWDSLPAGERIAKITSVGGAVACIVFAWIRKSMQQKKISNGAVDGVVAEDTQEDTMSEMMATFGTILQDVISKATPPPAPSSKK